MIITLTGSNGYALITRLNGLISEFVKEYGQLGLERIDGEEADIQTLIEAVQGTSLLSTNKLVIVRDLARNKSAQADIEQIISSTVESTNLIFVEPNIDRRNVYFKVLKGKTELHDFKELEGPELAKWLVNEAKKQGANLGSGDANYLIERSGASQSLLATELDKLITYESNVTRELIDKLVVENPQTKVFDLLDAAFSGRKHLSLKLYEQQRAQAVEPQEIISMIVWQLRLIVLGKVANKPPAQIAADTGSSSYPITKAAGLADNLSTSELKSMVNRLYKIDYLAKTKAIDLDEALRTYLVTI